MSERETEVAKVELRNVSMSYRDRKGKVLLAVKDASLRIENKPDIGELAVLLGPSGCGKSTILKAVAGLMVPDSGEVLVDGVPVTGAGRDRGMVFQNYTSFGWLTVRQNVEYGLRLQGIDSQTRRDQAEAILKKVGLSEFADAYPKQLSGGMKQRVAIARTLINNPKVMLMDEPFGALDPQTRWDMQALVLDVLKTVDNTALFVTHDIEEAVFLGDVIVVLSHRPASVLSTFRLPYFPERDSRLKVTPAFRAEVDKVMELLHQSEVHGDVRLGL